MEKDIEVGQIWTTRQENHNNFKIIITAIGANRNYFRTDNAMITYRCLDTDRIVDHPLWYVKNQFAHLVD